MNNWDKKVIGKAISFNPSESLERGTLAPKIPMGNLTEHQRKIDGFELAKYKSGPKFRNGDTLLAKITPCLENGKTAQVDILEEDQLAFGSSEFIVLRATNHTTPDFVYYLSISPTFRKKAISCMEGTSGRKRVRHTTLKKFELPFPSIEEQERITGILKAIDSKIELNKKINKELESMAKLIYDYWFVQFEFPDENRKPYKSSGGEMEYNKKLKREIPRGWKVGGFEDLGDIVGGSTPSKSVKENFTENGTPWITPKDLSDNSGKKFFSKGEWDVTKKGIKDASLNLLPKGTVLLSSRAPIGYLAIARNDVTTNQGFKSIVPFDSYPTEYVYYTVKTFIPAMIQYASGSTFKEISATILKMIKIHQPPEELIEKFSNKVKPIFKQQDLLEKENKELEELRNWLLPMLMNGQVTVKEAEEELSIAAEPGQPYDTSEQARVLPFKSTRETEERLRSKEGLNLKDVQAGVMAMIIQKHDQSHSYKDTLGHVKMEKLLHIIEAETGINLGRNPKRIAAGPADMNWLVKVEHRANKKRWFHTIKHEDGSYSYNQGTNIDSAIRTIIQYFPNVVSQIEAIIGDFIKLNREQTELVVTTYAAWHDLLAYGYQPSEIEIVVHASTEEFWTLDKEKFEKEKFFKSINWLKRKKLVPNGLRKITAKK
ncbi:restriction endonuclease subunit S [Gracilimonas sp.]|uniref:restriction endonuclease subunit S n=1 Tax=Gracilimonas sp. TaxID=1974203 RepID=UPI003BABBE5D